MWRNLPMGIELYLSGCVLPRQVNSTISRWAVSEWMRENKLITRTFPPWTQVPGISRLERQWTQVAEYQGPKLRRLLQVYLVTQSRPQGCRVVVWPALRSAVSWTDHAKGWFLLSPMLFTLLFRKGIAMPALRINRVNKETFSPVPRGGKTLEQHRGSLWS